MIYTFKNIYLIFINHVFLGDGEDGITAVNFFQKVIFIN